MTEFNSSRRELLRLMTAGFSAVSIPNWMPLLAADEGKRRKSCVVLWMDGGPSQTETYDPKSEASSTVHGGVKAIDTSVPGIQISEHLPKMSQCMQHAAIL